MTSPVSQSQAKPPSESFAPASAYWIKKVQDYLSYDYLTRKAREKFIEKVLPLSNPPGWEQKMKKAQQSLNRRLALKNSIEHQLKQLNEEFANADNKKKTSLEEQLRRLYERHANICRLIELSQNKVIYLEKQWFSQVSSRFASYAGMTANAVIPGSGLPVSLLLTGTTTALQEKFVDTLKDPDDLQQERKNIRFGTLCTIACTVASVAFSVLVVPVIKETTTELLDSISGIT